MNCPYREPCDKCKEMERGYARTCSRICALLAPMLALVAVGLALELDPRSSAWAGVAGGCTLMFFYYRGELRHA